MSANPVPPTNPPSVRRIIDHTQLHQIVEKLFCRLPIHAIENNQKHIVKVIECRPPNMEILHHLPPAQSRKLVLDKDNNTMLLECTVIERTARGGEVLKPARLTLTNRGVRHEERIAVGGGAEAGAIVNAIPHAEFYRFNAATHTNRDAVRTQYLTALRNLLPHADIKIDLQKSSRLSVRMKKLQDFRLPVFAPRIGIDRQGTDLDLVAMPGSEHQQIIRADGLPADTGSEICEPIYYRGVFIFGYAQAYLTEGEFSLHQYHSLRQFVRRMEADFEAKRCYPANPTLGKLSDISHGGAGFVFPMLRSLMSPVQVGDTIVFDVNFSAENRSTFSGRVASAAAQETGKRYGVEFDFLSEGNEKALAQVIPPQK